MIRAAEGEDADQVWDPTDMSIDAVAGFIGGGTAHVASEFVYPPEGELGPRPKGRRHAAKYDKEVQRQNRAALRAFSIGIAAESPVKNFVEIALKSAVDRLKSMLSFDPEERPLREKVTVRMYFTGVVQ